MRKIYLEIIIYPILEAINHLLYKPEPIFVKKIKNLVSCIISITKQFLALIYIRRKLDILL